MEDILRDSPIPLKKGAGEGYFKVYSAGKSNIFVEPNPNLSSEINLGFGEEALLNNSF